MKISELLSYLEKYKQEHGDVVLYSRKEDGHSGWNSPAGFTIKYTYHWPDNVKNKHHFISDNGNW